MLTEKTKKLFDEFWLNYEPNNVRLDSICASKFHELPLSMQWGVYQEFGDGLGYDMDVFKGTDYFCGDGYAFTLGNSKSRITHTSYETRNKAMIEAVKKLDESINMQ